MRIAPPLTFLMASLLPRTVSSFAVTSTLTRATSNSCRSASSSYEELVSEFSVHKQLERISALMHWDSMVMMPQTDANHHERGLQSAALAGVIHEKATSSRLGELIEAVDVDALDDASKVNYKLMSKIYREKTLIPESVAKEQAELSNSAYLAWTKARDSSDFSKFAPALTKCFEMSKTIASLKLGSNPDNISLYDKMLDDYEKGMPNHRITEIFDTVEEALVPLIDEVLASPHAPSTSCLSPPAGSTFPLSSQSSLNFHILDSLGFTGRSDVSVHPFTTSFSPSDVRLTSRFSPTEWYQGLAGSIHESGHALYESNLPSSPTPINSPLSMGVHESQSLFYERHVGLSLPFYARFLPNITANLNLRSYSSTEIHGAVNSVKRSSIRVEADELTYPLHVILRTRIERQIIDGDVEVADVVNSVPELWNYEMKRLLKIDIKDDAEGCLQDVHWSGLAFGYFPTYLISAIAAAQLEYYIRKDMDFEDVILNGEFSKIEEWMKEKIHRHGSYYGSLDEMFEAEFGERLNEMYYIDYLTNKYEKIYGLN
ncbi:hypothetical protein TrST_g8724 [Triparma strigata]|uniref:Carboxypeptidase n=1 Tax=Triparma strigata TaxID=1606541 RepID=A0A9W6ZCD5_9STRA|nr:hypothetical protein TrST_g8724 [Triparma strigata]